MQAPDLEHAHHLFVELRCQFVEGQFIFLESSVDGLPGDAQFRVQVMEDLFQNATRVGAGDGLLGAVGGFQHILDMPDVGDLVLPILAEHAQGFVLIHVTFAANFASAISSSM